MRQHTLWLITSLLVLFGLGLFITSPASPQLQDSASGIPNVSTVGVLGVNKSDLGQVACTQEAKLCPDGSSVGRTGPKCEFAECPVTNPASATTDAHWKIYRNEQYGFELRYPAELEVSSAIDYENLHKQGKAFQLHIGSVNLPDEVIITDYLSSSVRSVVHSVPLESIDHEVKTFNGINWDIYTFKVPGYGFEFTEAFGQNRGSTFRIGTKAQSPAFSQILSTFKFIPPTSTGILYGKVTVGPNCPVERFDNPCPAPPEAYASREFLIMTSDKKKIVMAFRADADGNYRVSLTPGTYVVESAKTGIGFGSKDLPATVTIKAGETAALNIAIDTGIR